MSDSRLKELLNTIVKKYNCKIWINKKIGKRTSFVEKAGNEYYLPPEVIYEDEEFIIFSENLNKKDDDFLKKILHEVIEYARNIEKNTKR
ncbi:hypothetical protein SU69_08115 [Thermosipho melanesiensis]|uniref:Uncharacterized protein n=2 Tax=Thermosipho melanesiensis TaxID=46541 RepID=A6LNE1_THEM4|nr:hypothetical protein [Thermosipho melanesiensis]ABR31442.1 hypothetical protein Tmel_1598 [Thermosipho melanesiensis BI429]APT74501.1 hypothetical protein BW47_08475 [Thermosipho melanesiensis]OOC36457.1 hypothetical protein SU68_08185 [Thermosipho melanesiensis]OOC37275.1 hypothetical protein SU69_08115 [Thermosipho melanesiensis]OOC38027.1 hypothetical protein SU70_08125 [Thermosipho melanesiensis]